MPGLAIRYLVFNTNDPVGEGQGRPPGHRPARRPRPARRRGLRRHRRAAVLDRPAGITAHTNSFFNKYGEPSAPRPRTILDKAGITTPVKLTLHYTTDHYGAATAKEFEVLREAAERQRTLRHHRPGRPTGQVPRPPQKRGDYPVYGFGWFPDFPDPDNFIAPVPRQGQLPQRPVRQQRDPRGTDPAVPPRARPHRRHRRPSPSIQNIVAGDVPVLPLWQGKQYVAARDDITGVEWALNSSARLQLWELGRGSGV